MGGAFPSKAGVGTDNCGRLTSTTALLLSESQEAGRLRTQLLLLVSDVTASLVALGVNANLSARLKT